MYVAILAVATLTACGTVEEPGASTKTEYVDAEMVTGSRLPPKKKKEAATNMAGEPMPAGQPKN
jgi:hypothetical protein